MNVNDFMRHFDDTNQFEKYILDARNKFIIAEILIDKLHRENKESNQ